jgi:hypothetical protein
MASAKVENYLSDLIGDWTKRVNASDLPTSELPVEIRARFFNQADVLSAYSGYFVTRDEHALAKRIIGFMTRDRKDFLAGTQPRPRLYASWILDSCKYPSPENLRHLFRRLGVSDVFHELNALAEKDVEMSVRSFNDLRSELAHQGNVAGVTHGDVVEKLAQEQELVRLLDQVAFARIGEIGGHSLWTV